MKGLKPHIWILASFIVVSIFFMVACSDNPEKPDNLPPEKASSPTPSNLSANIQQVGLELQWECSDPDNDSISYDLYLGTEANPPLVDSNIAENHYYADFLSGDQTYYWRIVARDSYGNQSSSAIWSFATGNALDFVYPLEVGYQWTYQRTMQMPDYDWIDSSSVEIDSMFEVDGIMMYSFHAISQSGDQKFESNSYYSNQSSGLLYFGSDGSGGINNTPAPIRNPKKYIFHGRTFNSIDEIFADLGAGSLIGLSKAAKYYDNPIMTLKYPLHMGTQWNYRNADDDIFWIDKKVIGAADVEVPAGLFRCCMVQWFYDTNQNGSWDDDITIIDYICAAGLIKRVAIFRNIIIYDVGHSEGIDTTDIIETTELTGYSLRRAE